jgi:hypothetical protein
MRCLHAEAAGIREYVSLLGLAVTRCDFERKYPPTLADADACGEMLERSETLWGTALPYYLYISRSFEAEAPALKQAVEAVEASGARDGFLIVAYQDGGLISVSAVELPFQANARPADWWAPQASAQRSSST